MGSKSGSKMNKWLIVGIVVIALAAIGGVVYMSSLSVGGGSNAGVNQVKDDGSKYAAVNCPDTMRNVYFKAVDTNAASTTQVSGTIHIFDGNTDIAQATLNSTTGSWSSGVQLCGANYKAVLFTSAGSIASAEKSFTVGDQNTYVILSTNQLSYLTATVAFDDTNPSTVAYSYANGGAGANSTGFTAINGTYIYTDTAATAKAIGADGVLRYTVTLHDATAKYAFGDMGADFKTYFCLRGSTTNTVWDFPSATVTTDGVAASVVSPAHEPNSNAGSYVKLSEVCYDTKTPFFSTNDHTIKVVLPTLASQNPGSSDDVVNYFLPEGLYQSVQSSTRDQALIGIYDDATSKSLVGTAAAYDPVITVQVS